MLPGIFEELMYRGIVFQRLRAVVSLRLALLVQAMLFSLMHVDPVYLLVGCLAGVLRLAAHARWPCMLVHMLWNAWIALHQYDWL